MVIGDRLRTLREAKDLSQGDIEKRTGLLRCYLSRVENGHTVPSVETLEKFARALELPLYRSLFDTDKPPAAEGAKHRTQDSLQASRSGALLMKRMASWLAKREEEDRNPILFMAGPVSKNQGGKKAGRKLASRAAA
jgi:transcriptional regulator with XRE-family HTH domain